MREILFRGQTFDTNEWVYGAFVPDALEGSNDLVSWGFIRNYNRDIRKMQTIEVNRETVGQFIGGVEFGTEDKGEKRKIFDGDIVQVGSEYGGKGVFLVVWNYESAGWYWKHLRGTQMFYGNQASSMKILGNRWDNPELLEGSAL